MKTTKSKKNQHQSKKCQSTQKQQPQPKKVQVNMGPLWFYSRKKLAMAFEFGLNFALNAKEMGIDVDRDMVVTAENIMFREFRKASSTKLAGKFAMLVLALMGSISIEKKK